MHYFTLKMSLASGGFAPGLYKLIFVDFKFTCTVHVQYYACTVHINNSSAIEQSNYCQFCNSRLP